MGHPAADGSCDPTSFAFNKGLMEKRGMRGARLDLGNCRTESDFPATAGSVLARIGNLTAADPPLLPLYLFPKHFNCW
jgi:hypothetical protein